jgi:hypothetical protein
MKRPTHVERNSKRRDTDSYESFYGRRQVGNHQVHSGGQAELHYLCAIESGEKTDSRRVQRVIDENLIPMLAALDASKPDEDEL